MTMYDCVVEGVEKWCEKCCCCCEWCWFLLARRRRLLREDSAGSILAQSRRYRWQPQFAKETGLDCHVCGQRFVVDDEVASLPCGCPFHYDCAAKEMQWEPRCPKCCKGGLERIASQGAGIRSWLSSFFNRTRFSPFSDDTARSVEMVVQSPSRRYPEWRIISHKKRVIANFDKKDSILSAKGGRKDEKQKFSWSIGITSSESVMESQYQVDITSSLTTRRVRVFVDGNLVDDIERKMLNDGSLLPLATSVGLGRYYANISSDVCKHTGQEDFFFDVPECFVSQHMIDPKRISQDDILSCTSPSSSSSASSLMPALDMTLPRQRPQSILRLPKWSTVTPKDISLEENSALSPRTVWDAWRVQLARDDADKILTVLVKVLWNANTDRLKIFINERLIQECTRGAQEKFDILIDVYQATILAVPLGHFELIIADNPNEIPGLPYAKSFASYTVNSAVQDAPTEDAPLIVPVESAHPVGKTKKSSKLRFIWRVVVIKKCQRVNHRVIVTWALTTNVFRIFINREEKTSEALVTAGSISIPGSTISGFTLHIIHAGGTKLQIALLPSEPATPNISSSSIMEPLAPESINRLFFATSQDVLNGCSTQKADFKVSSPSATKVKLGSDASDAQDTVPVRKESMANMDTHEAADNPEVIDLCLSLIGREREENSKREKEIGSDQTALESITPPWVLCHACRQRWFRAQAGLEDDLIGDPCTNVDGPCCLAAKIPKEPHTFHGEKRHGPDEQKFSYGPLHADTPSPHSGHDLHVGGICITPSVSKHHDATSAHNGVSPMKDSSLQERQREGDACEVGSDAPLQSGRSAPESESSPRRVPVEGADPLTKGRRRRRLLDDSRNDAEMPQDSAVHEITPRTEHVAENTPAELRLSDSGHADSPSDLIALRLDSALSYPRISASSSQLNRSAGSYVAPEKSRLGVGKLFRGSKLKYLWRVTTFDDNGERQCNRVTLTWSKRSHKVRIFDGSDLIGEHGRRPNEDFTMDVRIGQSMCRVLSSKWCDEFELEVGPEHEVLRGINSFYSQQVPSPTASVNSSFGEDQSTAVSETMRPRHATATPEFSKVGVGQFHKNSKLKYGWRLDIQDSEGHDVQFLLVLTWSKNSGRVRVMVEDRVLLDRSWDAKSEPFEALFPIGNHAVAVSGDGENDDFTVRIEDQS